MTPRTLLSALAPLPSRRSSRVAMGLLLTALLAATAGCEGIADIHDVTTGTGGTGGTGATGGAGPSCKEPTAEPAAGCESALKNGVTLEIGGGLSASGCTVIASLLDAEIPFPAGGFVFAADDPDTLLIVGDSGKETTALYSVPVARDAGCHVAALGKAVKIADVPNADGLAMGPDGALFFGRIPSLDDPALIGLGRMKAGSGTFDETFDLTSLGISFPVSGVGFVPEGLPGAGTFAFTTFATPNEVDPGQWYSAELAQDGKGPLDVLSITPRATFPHPSSFVFLGAGNGVFPSAKVLVTDYYDRTVSAYDIGPEGAPDTKDVTTVLTVPAQAGVNKVDVGPWGTALDPVTGDLLLVLYDLHELIALRGFSPGG